MIISPISKIQHDYNIHKAKILDRIFTVNKAQNNGIHDRYGREGFNH